MARLASTLPHHELAQSILMTPSKVAYHIIAWCGVEAVRQAKH